MSYTVQSRLIRGILVLTSIILTLHFLYSMRERVSSFSDLTGSRSIRVQQITPDPSEPRQLLRKIWQTGKNGPASLDDGNREAIKTWTKLNQNWQYEILTDYSAETYVRRTFGKDQPEILDLYMDIRDPILRADMLRYLILFGDGGVYSDMDTKCLKPIDDWVPHEYRLNTSVVVGIEYDVQNGGRWSDWTRDLQITNWAMMAKANHPMLARTVELLRTRMHAAANKKDTTISRLELEQLEVLDTTGPAMFTDAIFDHLSHVTGTNFTWHNLTNLQRPRLINDVLILPVTGFANSQAHSGSLDESDEGALVKHLFSGSWKGDRPADKHKQEEEEEKKKQEEEKKKKEEEEKKKEEEEKKKKEQEEQAEKTKKLIEEAKQKAEAANKKKEEEDARKAQEVADSLNRAAADREGVPLPNQDQDHDQSQPRPDEVRTESPGNEPDESNPFDGGR